jgi:hypothetical protein
LGLFSKRYGTPDWGQAYVGYIGWFVTVVIFGEVWIKCKARNRDKELNDNLEMQMGRGSNLYDPENDLTVAQFETVWYRSIVGEEAHWGLIGIINPY